MPDEVTNGGSTEGEASPEAAPPAPAGPAQPEAAATKEKPPPKAEKSEPAPPELPPGSVADLLKEALPEITFEAHQGISDVIVEISRDDVSKVMPVVKDDSRLDLAELAQLLQRVERTLHQQPNRVRYAMNGFVIALGSYVRELTGPAIRAAEKIGPVTVDMGNTACAVPFARDYIRKVEARGTIGKKRKSARC